MKYRDHYPPPQRQAPDLADMVRLHERQQRRQERLRRKETRRRQKLAASETAKPLSKYQAKQLAKPVQEPEANAIQAAWLTAITEAAKGNTRQ